MGARRGSGRVAKAIALAGLVVLVAAAALCTDDGDDDDDDGEVIDVDGGEESSGWSDFTEFERVLTNLKGFHFIRGDEPSDIETLEDPENTILLFFGADTNITPREKTAFDDLVLLGGTGLVACDSSLGDYLTRDYGLRMSDHRILATNFEFNWSFIPSRAELEGESYELLFNHPLAVYPKTESARTFAASVDFSSGDGSVNGTTASVADVDGDGEMDLDDETGPISILALSPPDEDRDGTVVAVSDTGAFNDDFIERRDNKPFLVHLLNYLMPDGGDLVYYTGAQSGARSPNIVYGDVGGSRAGGDDVNVDNGDLGAYHADGSAVSYTRPAGVGEDLELILDVHNDGGRWVDATVMVNVTPSDGGAPVLARAVNVSLGPGEVTPVTVTWTAQEGEFDLSALVVVTSLPSDDDMGDNRAVRPLTVSEGADLGVTMALSNENVTEGETLTVSARVDNYGGGPVDYYLELYESGSDDESLVERQEGTLEKDGGATHIFQWESDGVHDELKVVVEPRGVAELSPSDNEDSVGINVTAGGSSPDDDADEVEVPGPGLPAFAAAVALGALALTPLRKR